MVLDPDSTGVPHADALIANVEEVLTLVRIHETLTGTGPGRRRDVEVLNKSAVVLLVACWEAFVEDLAVSAFDAMLHGATEPGALPPGVLVHAGAPLRNDPDERKIWALAGEGWRKVLQGHQMTTIERWVGRFNSPKSDRIDDLFEKLVGLKNLSSHWIWDKITADVARKRLDELVELRGGIAHRAQASKSVRKDDVDKAVNLISRLAALSSNLVRKHVQARVGSPPWVTVKYKSTGE